MQSMVSVVRCRESIVLIQIFFCDQIMFWSFVLYGRDCSILIKSLIFIDLRINIICSNQSRQKKSKLSNIIWSEEKIWIKNITSRQQTVVQKLTMIPEFGDGTFIFYCNKKWKSDSVPDWSFNIFLCSWLTTPCYHR